MLFDNYETVMPAKSQFCNFHQKNPRSRHTPFCTWRVQSLLRTINRSLEVLLDYDRTERWTLEYLFPWPRAPARTPVTVSTFAFPSSWMYFHSSSTLSGLQITWFIQLDTCHFEKPLLVKLFLDTVWNHIQFIPQIGYLTFQNNRLFYNLWQFFGGQNLG